MTPIWWWWYQVVRYKYPRDNQKWNGSPVNTAPYFAYKIMAGIYFILDPHSTEYTWKALIWLLPSSNYVWRRWWDGVICQQANMTLMYILSDLHYIVHGAGANTTLLSRDKYKATDRIWLKSFNVVRLPNSKSWSAEMLNSSIGACFMGRYYEKTWITTHWRRLFLISSPRLHRGGLTHCFKWHERRNFREIVVSAAWSQHIGAWITKNISVSTHWPLGDFNDTFIRNFEANFSDWWGIPCEIVISHWVLLMMSQHWFR